MIKEELKDEKLVSLARKGDQDAEEILIRRYRSLVRGKSHSYFIVGGDLEDVVQEAMIGLFKAIRKYDEKNKVLFKTFAEVCVNRQICDAVERANRKKHKPLNQSVPIYEEMGIEPISNDIQEYEILLSDTFKFVSENKDNTFTNLELKVWNYYMEGMSYKEIAQAINKPVANVYKAMERTKSKIEKYLRD